MKFHFDDGGGQPNSNRIQRVGGEVGEYERTGQGGKGGEGHFSREYIRRESGGSYFKGGRG